MIIKAYVMKELPFNKATLWTISMDDYYLNKWFCVQGGLTGLLRCLGTNNYKLLQYLCYFTWITQGRLTPWTMKSDHGRWPFSMVRHHGPTFMGRFLKKSIYKVFGSFTSCKPNVDQEEWPCTKKWMCWFLFYFIIYVLKRQFWGR